jgi:hypothetical protein
MQFEIIQVTPRLARQWLESNTRNRPLRPAHVERLRASFERGEYVMTHQGVAFDSDGAVADGQHRLTAISLLPDNYSFPMLVTHGLDHDAAFPVIDVVMATRSVSDVLGVDRKVSEVGMFLCRLWEGKSAGVTPTLALPFIEMTAPTTSDLINFCGTTSKTWSSAPVRSAAVVSLMRGVDADYVKLMYRNLVTADFNAMTPVIAGLFKSHLNGKVRAQDAYDLFVRCLRAFDPSVAHHTKVQVKDASVSVAEVRAWLTAMLAKKNAPMLGGAKGKTQPKFNSGRLAA